MNGKFIKDLVPHKSFLLPYHQQINMNIDDENTWDETFSSERTGEQYERAPDFGRGRSAIDDEEPSLHSDSSTLLKGKQRSKFVMARKSTMAFLTFFLLASLAAFGYFFSEYMIQRQAGAAGCSKEQMNCPISQEDLENLQSEIDRLEQLNGQLSDQLEDYEEITNRLNASVEELKVQNEILTESNNVYEELNGRLNDTITELQGHNEFLAQQVETLTKNVEDLNATADRLEGEVDRLEDEVDNLETQNDRLEGLVDSLTNETSTLKNLTDVLQENVDRLEDKIGSLETENTRLEDNISNLETVVGFLDEVAGNIDETYEQLASFLAEQITTNRLLVTETLQNTYHQRVANWDCALRDTFVLEAFASDENLAIPNNLMSDVMDFVDERVLSDLCLDLNDFQNYLTDRYGNGDITTSRLVTSVQRYTWDALDYYFPEDGEEGLTGEDWATAEYDCGKLTVEQKFTS